MDRISATSERYHELAKRDGLRSVNVSCSTPGALLCAHYGNYPKVGFSVQEHTGLRATRIFVLGFTQRKPTKETMLYRSARMSQANRCKQNSTDGKSLLPYTPSSLSPRTVGSLHLFLLCCTSVSCVRELPCPADSPSLWSSHRSSTKQLASLTSVLAIAAFAAGSNRLLEVLQMVGGRSGPRNK